MKQIKPSTNFTIFLLFFGVAALEAVQTLNWLMVGFWVAISLIFLVADDMEKT